MRFKVLTAVLMKIKVSWQYACLKHNCLPCDKVCIPEDLHLNDNISDCGKMLAFLPSMSSQTLNKMGSVHGLSFASSFLHLWQSKNCVCEHTMPYQGLGPTWKSWSCLLPVIIWAAVISKMEIPVCVLLSEMQHSCVYIGVLLQTHDIYSITFFICG
jgi:hypothetical protein